MRNSCIASAQALDSVCLRKVVPNFETTLFLLELHMLYVYVNINWIDACLLFSTIKYNAVRWHFANMTQYQGNHFQKPNSIVCF